MKKSINDYKREVNMYNNELDEINKKIIAYVEKRNSYFAVIEENKENKWQLLKNFVYWFFKSNLTLVIVKYVPFLFGTIVPGFIYPAAYLIFFISFISKNDFLIESVTSFNHRRIEDKIFSVDQKIEDCNIEKEKIIKIIDCLGVLIERELANTSNQEQNGLEQVKNDYINKPLVKN